MCFKVYPSNLIFILLVAAPNLLFLLYPPVNTPVQPKGTLLWTLITCFEKIGQMAISPTLYFVFVGTCLDSFVMIGFSILLAIGHIPESYKQFLLSMKI